MDTTISNTSQLSHRPPFGGRSMFFLVLVSLLAGAFEVFLFLAVRRVPMPVHVPVSAYLLCFFHILPWLAGVSSWVTVRRSRIKGVISPTAADLCYGVIVALLSATYVVLGFMELTFILPWAMSR